MSEYIKKKDVSKIVNDYIDGSFRWGAMAVKIGRLQTYTFPDSAENKGEWIDNGNGSYTCSNCKTEWTTSQIEKMCFCPTCGADMRGE